jgi:peptidoglycan/LPS O-acetylase OafA/YrhL
LTIILFVLLALPFFYSVRESKSVSLAALYSLAYSGNIYFYRLVDYFDLAARENPLLHLWSLGVEEQFYLFIPVCVWFLWSVRRNLFLFNLLLLFVASFVWSCLALKSGHTQFAFYMLPSRAWELLAGAILCQLPPAQTGPAVRARRAIFSFSGLALVLLTYVFLNERVSFPAWAALPPVLGAALLIRYGAEVSWLSLPFFIGVGKISYSLYLWHWPIFVFLDAGLSTKRSVAAVVASVLAGWLSWLFIEMPVRKLKPFGPRRAFSMLIGGTALLAALCFFFQFKQDANGPGMDQWRGVDTWATLEKKHDPRRSHRSLADLNSADQSLLFKLGAADARPSFVLWGDSHALALVPGVDHVASEFGKAGYYIDLKHSLTMNAAIGADPFNPRADREPVLQWLESRPDLSDVFLANKWFKQISNSADIDETIAICQRLKKSGKHVFLFGSVPLADRMGVRLLSWGVPVSKNRITVSKSSYDEMESDCGEDQLRRRVAQEGLATVLPQNLAFFSDGAYHTGDQNHSWYFDNNHLDPAGAIKAMEFVAPMIWSSASVPTNAIPPAKPR